MVLEDSRWTEFFSDERRLRRSSACIKRAVLRWDRARRRRSPEVAFVLR